MSLLKDTNLTVIIHIEVNYFLMSNYIEQVEHVEAADNGLQCGIQFVC